MTPITGVPTSTTAEASIRQPSAAEGAFAAAGDADARAGIGAPVAAGAPVVIEAPPAP
ncbi:MAG: hypothetical protein HYZ20_07165, partial [Burkholderiales bacterium]|nr:hypothetical protein [Burkholderiales bacterium]